MHHNYPCNIRQPPNNFILNFENFYCFHQFEFWIWTVSNYCEDSNSNRDDVPWLAWDYCSKIIRALQWDRASLIHPDLLLVRDRHLFGEDPLGFKTSSRIRPSSRPPLGEEPVTLCIVLCWIRILYHFLSRWSSACVTLFLLVECSLVFFPRSPPRVLRVPRRDPLQMWKIGL